MQKPKSPEMMIFIYLFIFVLKQGLNYVPESGPGPPHPPKCWDLNMSTMPGRRPVFIQSFAVLKALFKLPSVFLPSQNTVSLRWGGMGFLSAFVNTKESTYKLNDYCFKTCLYKVVFYEVEKQFSERTYIILKAKKRGGKGCLFA